MSVSVFLCFSVCMSVSAHSISRSVSLCHSLSLSLSSDLLSCLRLSIRAQQQQQQQQRAHAGVPHVPPPNPRACSPICRTSGRPCTGPPWRAMRAGYACFVLAWVLSLATSDAFEGMRRYLGSKGPYVEPEDIALPEPPAGETISPLLSRETNSLVPIHLYGLCAQWPCMQRKE